MWALLDQVRSVRDYAKAQGWYPAGMNVHLVDQAAFNPVNTGARHIESCLAQANIKAKVSRRFVDENTRHYAYACLARYSALEEIMGGCVPELLTVTIEPRTRATVASYLNRMVRSAINNTWSRSIIPAFSTQLPPCLCWLLAVSCEDESGPPIGVVGFVTNSLGTEATFAGRWLVHRVPQVGNFSGQVW